MEPLQADFEEVAAGTEPRYPGLTTHVTPVAETDAWSSFVLTGLSQGGGHACLMGTEHHVARVAMFGAPKDFSLHFHRPANWLSEPCP